VITVRALDSSPTGVNEVRQLLNVVFPKARYLTDEYLDWCYYQNPVGPVVAANAYSKELLVGHLAGQPIRARLEGQDEPGLLAIHNGVRPEYRGQKVYAMMADFFVQEGMAAGYRFVIGFTNVASRNFVARRMPNFTVVSSLEAKIGIGPVPDASSRTNAQFARLWDQTTLRWRMTRPGAHYRMKSRNDQCALYALTHIPGMAAELGRFGHDAIDFQLPEPSRLSPWRLWIGLDAARDWSRCSYINLPRKLRPSPLALVFSDLSGAGRKLDAYRVHVQAIDLDAF
jgi:hypothetical protein